MKDGVFDLMTKMYADLTSRLDNIDKKLDSKSDKTDIARIENKLDTDSKALFDGYMQTYEKLEIMDSKMDEMSQNIGKQDIAIKVLKGGR